MARRVRPVVVSNSFPRHPRFGERAQGKQPGKWKVYEQILGVPYYITFNRYNDELQAFQLVGNRYQAMESMAGRIWMPDLELGCHYGRRVSGCIRQWLRWYDALGNWVPRKQKVSNSRKS